MSWINHEDDSSLEAELEEGFARMFSSEELGRAQDWVNWLDEAMELLEPNSRLYIRSLHKLRDLGSRAGVVPSGYFLPDTIELVSRDPVSHGGYSNVYQGFHDGLPVALKALRLVSADRWKVDKSFCREVIVWKRLVHPNIVPFLGVSTLFPNCLVSPWMPYGSVRSYMEANPDKDRSAWLLDVVKGLLYMHSLGLVHGDLKSANILLDSELRACLTDFGLAALVQQTAGLTASSGQGGSARWMAPEQFEVETPEQGRPTTRSDMYSLGVLWWELLTGRIPYDNLYNDAQVIIKRLHGDVLPEPEDAHPQLWRLILDCWTPNPHLRPTAEQALDRIEHLSTTSPETESPTTSWSFKLTHNAVLMPLDDDDDTVVLVSSPRSCSSLVEPDALDFEILEDPHDAVVEAFSRTLDDMDDGHSISSIISLNSSTVSLDLFSYDQNDSQDQTTSRWHYGQPMSTSSTDYAIAFGSPDGRVRVWTMRADSFDCQSFQSSPYGILALKLSPAGHVVTAGNIYDPITRMWDLTSGTATALDSSDSSILRVEKVLFSSDSAFLVKLGTRSDERTCLEIWDLETVPPARISTMDTPDGEAALRLVAISPDDASLVAVDRDSNVSIYLISKHGRNLAHYVTHTPHSDWRIDAVAFCNPSTVRLLHLEWWTHTLQCATMDTKTGFSSLVPLRNPAANSWRKPQITCTAISQNGNRIVIGFQGGHIQAYHAADGRPVGHLLEHHGEPDKPAVTAVAFTASSDCLFSTDATGTCWLWHVPSGRAVIAFTPDGGIEHQDVAVLAKFRAMVTAWRREQRVRRDSESTLVGFTRGMNPTTAIDSA